MKKLWMPVMLTAIVAVSFLLIDRGLCETIKGYSSYIQLLPGGKDRQRSNLDIIERAKEEVTSIEAEKKNREIKFDRPIDIHYLNSKYTMLSFEVFIKSNENSRFSPSPSIFALLFEGTGRGGLNRYTSKYIKWIGKNDLEDYRNSHIKEFCGYFRRAGVDDCVPDADSEKTVSEAPKVRETPSGGGSSGAINADRITSGTVRADRIDKSIARKSDVDNSLSRIERLNSYVSAHNEKLGSLANEIKGIDAQVKAISSSGGGDSKKIDERIKQIDEKINQLGKHIELQTNTSNELKKQLEMINGLLQGLSRNGSTLTLSGANFQIVNGSGSSHGETNGLGNLIIGYNEKKPGEPIQTGSHAIITPGNSSAGVAVAVTGSSAPPRIPEATEQVQDKKGKSFFKGSCFIESLYN